MKVIITGGSGFIGTNMIDFFIKKNATILNIDIKKPVNENHLQFWQETNILDQEKITKTLQQFQPDYIIHLAARTDLNGKNISDYDSNTLGTLSLINSANQVDSIKRIVFTSSMLVCKIGYVPKNFLDYKPNTPYGDSKVEMENIIYNNSINTEWTIIRPTSIWGPFFNEPYRNFFDLVIKGLFIHPGSKACTKTYGFIGNSVHQIYQLMTTDKEKIQGKCFYIGDTPPIPISEWADEIKMMHCNKKNIKFPYFIFILLGFTGDILKLIGIKFPMTSFRLKNMTINNIINLEHLNKVTGKNPFSRYEGVKETLNWLNK
jgi:GlcNAc-P-P-Und epimerase